MRRQLALFTPLLAVLGLAVAAGPAAAQAPCGGLLQPACQAPAPAPAPPPPANPQPAPAPPPPAAAEPAPPIPRDTYDRLEPYLVANAGRSYTRYVRACRRLSTKAGALVAGLSRSCQADWAATRAFEPYNRCRTSRGCARTVRRFSTELTREGRLLRAFDRITRREVPSGPCREALAVAPGDLRVFRRFVRVYQRIDRAYRVGSARRHRSALRQLKRVEADFKDFRSPKRQLRDFRASCR